MRHAIAFLLALSIQSHGHAQIASQTAPVGAPPLVYSSAVWRVYSEVKRYEGPRYLVFRDDGSKKEIGPGSMIPSAKIFIYTLSNGLDSAQNRVCQTTLDAPPSVVTVLKDGTLVLGVQREDLYLRFIGRDPKPVDVPAKSDGVTYEPICGTDKFMLMRARDGEASGRVFVVPLSEKNLDLAHRVVLTDETGRAVALPKSIRLDQDGKSITWHDADKAHSFTIPESVVGKP